MEDSWEVAYGLSLSGDDGALDSDGDGISNMDEYLAGSRPDDPAPTVSILVPSGRVAMLDDEPLILRASANDVPDGDLSSQVTWASDIQGGLGTGETISVQLSAGTHVVSASVTDSSAGEPASTPQVIVDVYASNSFARDGDIDEDGVLTISDLILLQQHLLGKVQLSPRAILKADVYPQDTRDGVVDISDLVLIKNALVAGAQ